MKVFHILFILKLYVQTNMFRQEIFFKKGIMCGNDVTAFEVDVIVSNTKKIEYLKSGTCLFYERKKILNHVFIYFLNYSWIKTTFSEVTNFLIRGNLYSDAFMWNGKGIQLPKIFLFKATIETLKKDVNYVQSQQLKHHNDVIDVLVLSLLTLNIFHTYF